MKCREFFRMSTGVTASATLTSQGWAQIDAIWYRRSRRFASLSQCEMAYVEHGRGPAALFPTRLTAKWIALLLPWTWIRGHVTYRCAQSCLGCVQLSSSNLDVAANPPSRLVAAG
jgi:hypothetical protein